MLQASQVKEERKVKGDLQVCLYQDQVEEMELQGLPALLAPLGNQATRMALWSVNLDHLGTRVLQEFQDSQV